MDSINDWIKRWFPEPLAVLLAVAFGFILGRSMRPLSIGQMVTSFFLRITALLFIAGFILQIGLIIAFFHGIYYFYFKSYYTSEDKVRITLAVLGILLLVGVICSLVVFYTSGWEVQIIRK